MIYTIDDELSAAIVDEQIAVLLAMPDLTPEQLRIDLNNSLTQPQIRELIRINTKNSLVYQQWLSLIRMIVPEDVDDKIRLLRDLNQRRFNECLAIITALQSGSVN
jgi:hypothetical protein